MRFDPSRPHGVVSGMPGVAYEQDRKFFTPAGELYVEKPAAPAAPPAPKPSEAEIDAMGREDLAMLASRFEIALDKRMTDLKWRRIIKESLGYTV